MLKVKRSLGLALTSILLTSLVVAQLTTRAQQQQDVTQTPVPEQLLSAHKIFIANAPGDISTTDLMKMYDGVNQPYSEFYTSIRNWGKFVLVSSPSEADLIFAFSYTSPIHYVGNQARLVILDPKTPVPLWWFAESVGGGGSKNTRQKDLEKGIDTLIADLKRLYTAQNP